MQSVLEDKKYGFGIDYIMIALIILACIILFGGIYFISK